RLSQKPKLNWTNTGRCRAANSAVGIGLSVTQLVQGPLARNALAIPKAPVSQAGETGSNTSPEGSRGRTLSRQSDLVAAVACSDVDSARAPCTPTLLADLNRFKLLGPHPLMSQVKRA